jgi:bifunctional aromatase (cyclase/dehydratase)
MLRLTTFTVAVGLVLCAQVAIDGQKVTALTPEDYNEIHQLYARYNIAIDKGDAEGWAATFTSDGVFGNSKGRDALVLFIHEWRDKRDGANRRHWNSNLVVTPAADGNATGSVYLMLIDIGVRPPVIALTAMYEDTLVKTQQGWRFKTRAVRPDPPPRSTK